jgi:hypothetical protein
MIHQIEWKVTGTVKLCVLCDSEVLNMACLTCGPTFVTMGGTTAQPHAVAPHRGERAGYRLVYGKPGNTTSVLLGAGDVTEARTEALRLLIALDEFPTLRTLLDPQRHELAWTE